MGKVLTTGRGVLEAVNEVVDVDQGFELTLRRIKTLR